MFSVGDSSRTLPTGSGERRLFRLFASILFALVHLLDESFGFFLIGKRQSGRTFFQLKGVEKCSILIIMEAIVDLLVPDNSATGGLFRTVSEQRKLCTID